MISEVWAIEKNEGVASPGKLINKEINIGSLGPEDIYVAPLYGCWEANIQHAIQRQPVDICQQRGESFIVPGNACVAKVLEIGSNVSRVKKGDICMGFGIVKSDAHGYPITVVGYDAPKVVGILAKRTRLHQSNMIPLPSNNPFSLKQWAAFSARYVAAWSNWNVAFNCWKAQMGKANTSEHFVCAWGGGVSLAELKLARDEGFQTIMITSKSSRMDRIAAQGIRPLNRLEFPGLNFQPHLYLKDVVYRDNFKKNEMQFLNQLKEYTNGKMAAIFIENIGQPVYRTTLKSLARQGVFATCGWKMGMQSTSLRAIESINRHVHVHTHYASLEEVVKAMVYAVENDWIPEIEDEKVYHWEEIPVLSDQYTLGNVDSYYPIFEVNSVDSVS